MPEQLYFGTAAKNITPQTPLPLAGYFRFRVAKEILDELEVRALLFRQGEVWSAIVQFDLLTVSTELAEAFYREIADIAELSPENMIVTATHTHTAPVVSSARPGFNPDYLAFASRQAALAVREARNSMIPGEMARGKTRESRFAFNRRYWMKNGSVMTNPGKLNPDIDRPEGEIDAEIPLLGIRQNGRLKVLIANIVNHADTVGGSCVSADWPGFFCRAVKAGLGSGVMVLPLIGASGNINHWDVGTAESQTSYADAERIGRGYAETVLKAVPELAAALAPALAVKQTEVIIPPREISAAELQMAEYTLEKLKNVPDIAQYNVSTPEELVGQIVEKYYAQAIVNIAGMKEPFIINLVGIFLGDVCISSLPCEPFVEIGLELKNKIFREYNVMVVSHSNSIGHKQSGGAYIPNSFNYERGGYEIVPRSSPLSVKTADLLIDAWKRLMEESGKQETGKLL
jgi:hypothetical protein